MSALNQNAPRMRRHRRRINDDGSELAHAVRAFTDDAAAHLLPRQADGSGRSSNAPAMGGFGGFGDSGDDDTDTDTATTTTATRGSSGNSDANGNARPTSTAASTTQTRNLFTTTPTSSSSSRGSPLDSLLQTLGFESTTSSSSTTPSSTSTSTSISSSTSTSSSSRSTSTSSSTSLSRTSIVPITATAVVTATPTGISSAATASATPKSSSSSAGPIIGIVAGALVGVVVLSGLVGFLFKKYRKQDDPYEGNPFDRDAFQRHSAMIPDHFDSDEGHAGAGGMSPEMSEHYHQYNNYGPAYESGISAGAAGAMAAHNEGGPRPPTMFAKHAAGVQQNAPMVGGYYKDGDYSNQVPAMPAEYHTPPVAAYANHHADQQYLDEPGFGGQRSISPAPQLPAMAAFGGDPYSIAGVGRGQQAQNVANPYAHLDRQFVPGSVVPTHRAGSASVSSGEGSADQRHASINAAETLAAGLAHQSSLNRNQYDTAGRPGTSEGRSGTPDLPNVQQTYAGQGQQHQQLSVRNLVPNGGNGQRPVSTASSLADPEDAYGGVY